MFLTGFTKFSAFLYQSLSLFLCMVFNPTSPKIDEVLSINPSANLFVFGDFNINHKDWLTFTGGTNRPCELCRKIVNFPTQIRDCDSHSPTLLGLFLSADTSICSTILNSHHVVASDSIDFPINSKWMSAFIL